MLGPDLRCNGGLGFRGALALYGIALVGTPLVLTYMLRRAGQRNAASIAWSAETVLVGVSAVILWPLFERKGLGAGTSLVWEIVTQWIIVPVYVLLLCRWTQPKSR